MYSNPRKSQLSTFLQTGSQESSSRAAGRDPTGDDDPCTYKVGRRRRSTPLERNNSCTRRGNTPLRIKSACLSSPMLDAADRQINRERDGADRLIDRAACLAPGGENSPSRKALSLSLDPPSTYRINRPRACLFSGIDSVLILVLLFFLFSRERKVERRYLVSTRIVKTTTVVEKSALADHL